MRIFFLSMVLLLAGVLPAISQELPSPCVSRALLKAPIESIAAPVEEALSSTTYSRLDVSYYATAFYNSRYDPKTIACFFTEDESPDEFGGADLLRTHGGDVFILGDGPNWLQRSDNFGALLDPSQALLGYIETQTRPRTRSYDVQLCRAQQRDRDRMDRTQCPTEEEGIEAHIRNVSGHAEAFRVAEVKLETSLSGEYYNFGSLSGEANGFIDFVDAIFLTETTLSPLFAQPDRRGGYIPSEVVAIGGGSVPLGVRSLVEHHTFRAGLIGDTLIKEYLEFISTQFENPPLARQVAIASQSSDLLVPRGNASRLISEWYCQDDIFRIATFKQFSGMVNQNAGVFSEIVCPLYGGDRIIDATFVFDNTMAAMRRDLTTVDEGIDGVRVQELLLRIEQATLRNGRILNNIQRFIGEDYYRQQVARISSTLSQLEDAARKPSFLEVISAAEALGKGVASVISGIDGVGDIMGSIASPNPTVGEFASAVWEQKKEISGHIRAAGAGFSEARNGFQTLEKLFSDGNPEEVQAMRETLERALGEQGEFRELVTMYEIALERGVKESLEQLGLVEMRITFADRLLIAPASNILIANIVVASAADPAGWSRIECHNAMRRFTESDLGLSGRDLANYCAQNDRRFDDIAQCLANLSRGSETLALSASELELVLARREGSVSCFQ